MTALEQIKQLALDLTPEEKLALARFLAEPGNQRAPSTAAESSRGENYDQVRKRRMDWLKSHRARYGGQYVVLDGDKLLGTAKTFLEGRRIAVSAGVPDAFVNYLSRPDEEGYVGNW